MIGRRHVKALRNLVHPVGNAGKDVEHDATLLIASLRHRDQPCRFEILRRCVQAAPVDFVECRENAGRDVVDDHFQKELPHLDNALIPSRARNGRHRLSGCRRDPRHRDQDDRYEPLNDQ